jgi:hypothetical protein
MLQFENSLRQPGVLGVSAMKWIKRILAAEAQTQPRTRGEKPELRRYF